MITTIRKSFVTLVIIGTFLSSFTLSLTGNGLIVIPIASGIACGLMVSNKVLHEIVRQR